MRIGNTAFLYSYIIYIRVNFAFVNNSRHMITVTQSISGTYFSANIPDVVFSISGYRAAVTMAIDGTLIYSEQLYPIEGVVTLAELDRLITPFAQQQLKVQLAITIDEQSEDSDDTLATTTLSADIIYCEADINISAEDFIASHFLTTLEGEKTTAIGRLEYLHFIGTDSASVTADYDDGTQRTFTLLPVGGNERYTTIDISPAQFANSHNLLLGYVVQAGARSFRFTIDFDEPDCAPVLVFDNSFGVEELLYCTGTHTVAPTYKRSQGYIGRYQRNYSIVETRTFKADTGVLSFAMANWADELFRSQCIHVVNFKEGQPNVGKEVIITDSKSEYTNDDNSMPRFTFSYQYAQRNHNVFNTLRAGRIFDNTFDNTFN